MVWEPIALCLMWTTITFLLPFFFSCVPFYEGEVPRSDPGAGLLCEDPTLTYNPMAMLTTGAGEGLVNQLFSRCASFLPQGDQNKEEKGLPSNFGLGMRVAGNVLFELALLHYLPYPLSKDPPLGLRRYFADLRLPFRPGGRVI
jgi:hypothetical protein